MPGADGSDGVDGRAYLFALAPVVVVLAVTPGLAALPGPGVGVGPLRFAGPPLAGGGLALVGWTVHTFARAGEPPSPADEPGRLVTGGALAHSRNPLYLGTVLAAAGVGLALDAPVAVGYAAFLWLVYHLLTVYREEPQLRAAFGEDYERYCESVPRWLPHPRLSRSSPR